MPYTIYTTIYFFFIFFAGLTLCYQRQSVSNNNHNNAEAKPTHLPPLHYPHGHKWNEPYFDLTMPRNITSLVGKSAYLGCRVKHLGNKTVSFSQGNEKEISKKYVESSILDCNIPGKYFMLHSFECCQV